MPIHIAPSFTVYPENLKTRIPIYFDSTRSEIDFLDNLPIEERNQPLLDTKCIFQVCLDDEHVIRPGFHHIDDFTEAIAFRRNYRSPSGLSSSSHPLPAPATAMNPR